MKILVVDDSPIKMKDIIESIRDTEMGQNAEILTETCGHAALMILLTEDIDYLISDMHYKWRMNEMDDHQCGIRLLREMKDAGITTKTIICSSGRTRVEDFDNVVGYVMYQGRDMGKYFENVLRG